MLQINKLLLHIETRIDTYRKKYIVFADGFINSSINYYTIGNLPLKVTNLLANLCSN